MCFDPRFCSIRIESTSGVFRQFAGIGQRKGIILADRKGAILSPGRTEEKPRFLRCQNCRRIFRAEEVRGGCPQCGTNTETESWPDAVVERLFTATEAFFKKGDKEITVILACDLLEALLEMFLRDLFVKQGRPPSWIQLIFKKNKSIDLRLRYLFKDTLHVGFASVIQGTPFEGFDRRWAMMRSTRGVLLHLEPSPVDEMIAREAYDLSKHALALFAWFNNQYCA